MEGLGTLKCVRGARRRGCVDAAAVLTRTRREDVEVLEGWAGAVRHTVRHAVRARWAARGIRSRDSLWRPPGQRPATLTPHSCADVLRWLA